MKDAFNVDHVCSKCGATISSVHVICETHTDVCYSGDSDAGTMKWVGILMQGQWNEDILIQEYWNG